MKNIKNEYTVDLKWSLWSADKAYWDEHQSYNTDNTLSDGSLWDAIKDAFEGNVPPITIHTAPWKEIRYGTVIISEGSATITFYTEWDEVHDQVPESILHDNDRTEAFIEYANFWLDSANGFIESNPLGAWINKTITASSFDELMLLIDKEEDALLIQEKKYSAEFDAAVNSWLEKDSIAIKKHMIGSKASWQVTKQENLYPFAVDAATGTINHFEYFRTKRDAQEWIDSGFPVAGFIERTHIVWASSIKDAYEKDKACILYQFPQSERLNLAILAEDAGLDVFSDSTKDAIEYFKE